jgi:iron complex outermembrane receptor protein
MITKHLLLSARLSVVLTLFAVIALGQTTIASDGQAPLKNLSLEQLGNVEITITSKEPVPAWRTAAATYVVTQEDIRRSGATSVADALRLVPGVQVSRISSTTWAIGVRGLHSDFSKSVLVLIDGRSVYTPLSAGVFWDIQDVILEDIDRIEVTRGPGATIWGPNAVNGVINIITKSSADTHGLLVSTVAGSLDRTIGEVRYGGSVANINYRVYAKGFLREPMFHANGNDFDRWHQERSGFRSDWTAGSNTFVAEGDIYGGTSPHLVGNSVVEDQVSGGNVLGRWRRELGPRSDLYLQGYFDRTIRIGPALGETRNTFDIDFLHHIRVGRLHEFSWGGGLRWSPNHVLPRFPTAINVLPNIETDHIHTAFGQDQIHLLRNRVVVTLGAKLQHNNYTGFDVQPTLRALWAPSDRQSYWVAVTRAVTTPSRIEEDFLLSGPIAPNAVIRVVGSDSFRSESVIGYEAGFRHLFTPNLSMDVSAFHNRYDDLQSFGAPIITIEPPNLVLTIPYANAIAGTTNGVELNPAWNVRPWWRIDGSYSYVGINLHANGPTSDISGTGSVPTYEGSSPHHQVKIDSRLNMPGGFEFDQTFRFASALPAQKVSSFSTADVRFGWKSSSGFELSVVGQNLLAPYHYEWGTGDPTQQLIGIRRAIYGKVVWTSQVR